MSHNLTIKLSAREDRDGATFYVGKLKMDASINFEDGVTFLVYVSDKGEEQLQLAQMENKKDKDSKVEKK